MNFFEQQIWFSEIFVASDPTNTLDTRWLRGPLASAAAVEHTINIINSMLGSNKVPGKALIKLADESRPPAERDETVGFTVQFISGGTEYSIQLSVTVSDDGTFSYLFGRVQAKLDLAAPMSEIFWLSKTRTLESYEFLKIGGKYFHQWLGATEDGDMYIREDEDDETSNIVYTLSTGSHGEAAHVITRRATLENFLKFIRGDAAPSESQWSAMGLGLTTLINELNES